MAKRKLKNKVVKKTTKKSKAKNKSSKTKPKSKSSSKKLTTKKELQILESEMKTVLGRTQRLQTRKKDRKTASKSWKLHIQKAPLTRTHSWNCRSIFRGWPWKITSKF